MIQITYENDSLVNLLVDTVRDAVRLHWKTICVCSAEGGSFKLEFENGSHSVQSIPTRMYRAIRESREQLIARSVYLLQAEYGLSAYSVANQLKASCSEDDEIVLEICD